MEVPSTHFSELRALRTETGERAALARLVVRYRDVILNWCLRRIDNRPDAEDLTQDIIVKLLNTLPRGAYDPSRARFRSWLKSVVNNAITDFQRRQERRLERSAVGGTMFMERVSNEPDDSRQVESASVVADRQTSNAAAIVESVRAATSPKSWEVFRRATYERHPAARIASDFGLTVGAVYKTTFRVKRRLLKEYQNVYHSCSLC